MGATRQPVAERYLLVLSGQVCREHSADLRNFWSGFINIQRTLNCGERPLDVIAHSWSPAYDALVRQVYDPIALSSEAQPDFGPEYYPLIDPVDRFERGLKRCKSTWKRCSPQALLGNARSRARAMALIDEVGGENYTQVIASRWDQGLTGSRSVNRIVHDPSLPDGYLYMAYYSEIDEGYADMWFVAPVDIAKRFAEYDTFVLQSLAGENGYVERFTQSGWPLALTRNETRRAFKRYAVIAVNKLPMAVLVRLANKLGRYAGRKVQGLADRIRRFTQLPEPAGENALDFETEQPGRTWPAYQALNNHALLKFFVYEKGLRARTRFLDVDDFNFSGHYGRGTLINPKPFAYVIYSHSSFADCWPMAIGQAEACLPANCTQIVLLTDDSDATQASWNELGEHDGIRLLTYDDAQPYTERLKGAFETLAAEWPVIYFAHEDMPLTGKPDAYYLNALLHYFSHSNERYIKLVDTSMVDEKLPHPAFPGLVSNTGGYAVSVQPALIKPDEFAKFLTHFRCGIYDFENICERANLKALAVTGNRQVGKYLLANDTFPQICTAIAKGKWCTSEWPDEIHQLADHYRIDLDQRGCV